MADCIDDIVAIRKYLKNKGGFTPTEQHECHTRHGRDLTITEMKGEVCIEKYDDKSSGCLGLAADLHSTLSVYWKEGDWDKTLSCHWSHERVQMCVPNY